MKIIWISALFLTLALNAMADEVIGLKSNNPPLTGELAGVKECQLAEVSDDSVVFKTFFYKERANNKGMDVYAVTTTEQHRIKAFKQPAFTNPEVSVVNPPDKDVFNLTFDGEKNKDKSSVLDLSLKLCMSKAREKELVDINTFLQEQVLVAAEYVDKTPILLRESYQLGYLKGLSQKTIASFILGKAQGQLEGLVVGYQKGAADGLDIGFKLGVVTTLDAIRNLNGRSGNTDSQGFQRLSSGSFVSEDGAFTPKMIKTKYEHADPLGVDNAEQKK